MGVMTCSKTRAVFTHVFDRRLGEVRRDEDQPRNRVNVEDGDVKERLNVHLSKPGTATLPTQQDDICNRLDNNVSVTSSCQR